MSCLTATLSFVLSWCICILESYVYACKMKPFIFTWFIVTSNHSFIGTAFSTHTVNFSSTFHTSIWFITWVNISGITCSVEKLVNFLSTFSQKETSVITFSCSTPFGACNKITEMLFCDYQLALNLCVILMAMLQFAIII